MMLQNYQNTDRGRTWSMTLNKISTLLLLCMVLLYGCTPVPIKGPNYQNIEFTSNEKGLVYVYWLGKNERLDFSINAVNESANEDIVFNMKRGGYYMFESSPGDLHLETSANFTFGQMALLDMAMTFDEELNLNIEPGKKYYVRCIKTGHKGSFKLGMEHVYEGRGLNEIQDTKLISNDSDDSDDSDENVNME